MTTKTKQGLLHRLDVPVDKCVCVRNENEQLRSGAKGIAMSLAPNKLDVIFGLIIACGLGIFLWFAEPLLVIVYVIVVGLIITLLSAPRLLRKHSLGCSFRGGAIALFGLARWF